MELDGAMLAGDWLHAHEEDLPGTLVFRRATADLPPSRGRTALSIAPDLTALRSSPGADDGMAGGAPARLVAAQAPDAGGPAVLKVLQASPDRLVLER